MYFVIYINIPIEKIREKKLFTILAIVGKTYVVYKQKFTQYIVIGVKRLYNHLKSI